MNKIKILYNGESSGALSGFGKYGREVLSRLFDNDRLEIAELASFGAIEEASKYAHVKWKYYPAAVSSNHPEYQEYESKPQNKWGAWRFERTLLDFKPHFVFDIRDPWNFEYCRFSPFRKFFHWAVMPTVDSAPQRPQWIELFRDADSVFTYSDWAIPVLHKQCPDINPICSAYPGVDLNVFQPRDKALIRRKLGLPEDSYIIGFTSRNQRRKLFPELFKAFRIFLDRYGHTDIGKKTYLYLHTSYPDFGWELPDLLNEFGITNRVYFSYICQATKAPIVSKWLGTKSYSQYSNGISLALPNVVFGYTEEQLAETYNILDLYIQYANCEGMGMSQPEAAACGIPIAAINYSAMADVVEKTGGIALEPASIPRDPDLNADRVAPDNSKTADAIFKFLCLDKKYKEKKGKQARAAAEKYFNWDRTAKIWSNHFENTELTGLQGKWDVPPQMDFNIPDKVPDNLNNTQFIQWLSVFMAKNPELSTEYFGLSLLKQLNVGPPFRGITREQVVDIFKNMGKNNVLCEQARCGIIQVANHDFVEFAHTLEDYRKNND